MRQAAHGVYTPWNGLPYAFISLCLMAAVGTSRPNQSAISQCTILLIEDDANDVFLFERAFAQSKIPCEVHAVESVMDGMDYLNGNEPYKDRVKFPLPNLIVTDLAFRGESGLYFLNWFHSQDSFRHIPVICITGSSDPQKLQQARNFGARCVEKCAMLGGVIETIRDLLPPTVTRSKA
jgi:CheY-like chemotaxis protein